MPGQIAGVVVSAGKMMKTVKVRVAQQAYNAHIRKHYPSPTNILVSDPNSSLREGDVVSITAGWRTSKHVRHVVTSIIAPFGPAITERPPVPSEEARMAKRADKRTAKDERRRVRREEGVAGSDNLSRDVMEKKKTDQKMGKPILRGQKPQDVVQEARRKSQKRVEKAVKNEEELTKVKKRVEGEGQSGAEVARGLVGQPVERARESEVAEEVPSELRGKNVEGENKDKSEPSKEGIMGRVSKWWGA
ncbi:MAG: hypothetical protein M1812_000957 [Candelaria pacifica]|nr:MAG: hypothetical protein M1812_000957 [Candelaria pacifica]